MITKITANLYTRNTTNRTSFTGNPINKLIKPLQNDVVQLTAKKINENVKYQTGLKFALKEIQGIPCPDCGKRIFTNNEMNKIAHFLANAKSEKLIKILNDLLANLHPIEENIATGIIKLAKMHPKKNLQELLIELEPKYKNKTINSNIKILEKMLDIKSPFNDDLAEEIRNSILLGINILKREENINPLQIFTRTNFIKRLLRSEHKIKTATQEIYFGKIIVAAEKLPYPNQTEGEFIKHYKNQNSFEIAKALIDPSSATVDHVVAKTKGGPDTMDNLLLKCRHCNEEKGGSSYRERMDTDPSLHIFHQRSIDAIIEQINAGKLPEFKNYPAQIKATLARVTAFPDKIGGSFIELDISKLNPPK